MICNMVKMHENKHIIKFSIIILNVLVTVDERYCFDRNVACLTTIVLTKNIGLTILNGLVLHVSLQGVQRDRVTQTHISTFCFTCSLALLFPM